MGEFEVWGLAVGWDRLWGGGWWAGPPMNPRKQIGLVIWEPLDYNLRFKYWMLFMWVLGMLSFKRSWDIGCKQ